MALAVERGEIELVEPLGVAEDVDLGDFPAPDREGQDRERLSVERADEPRSSVDERRAPQQVEIREALRSAGHPLGTAKLDQLARTDVASEDHVRVEHSDEPVEVTLLRRDEK